MLPQDTSPASHVSWHSRYHKGLFSPGFDSFLSGVCWSFHGRSLHSSLVFWPIAQGVVAGLKQTSLRGELCGALAALKYCVNQPLPCRLLLWQSECLWHAFCMVAGPCTSMGPQTRHGPVVRVVRTVPTCQTFLSARYWRFKHMPSRLTRTQFIDEWAVQGNIAADTLAQQRARHCRGNFWQTWTSVRDHRRRTSEWGTCLFQMFVQLVFVHVTLCCQIPLLSQLLFQQTWPPTLMQASRHFLTKLLRAFQSHSKFLKRVTFCNGWIRWRTTPMASCGFHFINCLSIIKFRLADGGYSPMVSDGLKDLLERYMITKPRFNGPVDIFSILQNLLAHFWRRNNGSQAVWQ